MAQCYPSREAVRSFKVPLMPGEAALVDALVEHLPDDFEVYVQPFVNGDRPDIVVLRRGAGVLLVEVKDWTLSAYETGAGNWKVRSTGTLKTSPVQQVEAYKKNLFDLHVERLAIRCIFDRSTFGVVRCAVYLHDAATNTEAKKACGDPRYVRALGREVLSAEGVLRFVRASGLSGTDRRFDDELYDAFRKYLHPGEHHPDEGKTIVYTASQKAIVESVAGQRRKVRGVAGCGKTRVLAGRAVSAHQRHGGQVLILTYNISLCNYIHDRVSDVRAPFPWAAFEITNYHQFFKAQAAAHSLPSNTLEDANDAKFFESVKGKTCRYATILVDEVQDYESEWLRLIADYFLEDGGELIVFGDEKQNVYNRPLDEQKLPIVPGLGGDWRTLKESHRLGPGSLRLAQSFQKHFFDGDEGSDDVEQADLFAEKGTVRYHHCPDLSDDALYALVTAELDTLGVHPNQVAILAPTVETVRALDLRLRTKAHERTATTFETQEEYDALVAHHWNGQAAHPKDSPPFKMDLKKLRRTRKLHFWPNPGTVKLSTVLSFKGWEAHTLVLVLRDGDLRDDPATDEVVYTALTRAKTNAVVVATGSHRYGAFFHPYAVAPLTA